MSHAARPTAHHRLLIVLLGWLVWGGWSGPLESVWAQQEKRRDITFDDIKLDIEKDSDFDRSMLTKEVEELHKKPIRIRGYMLPAFQQKGIKQFVLVRDNMECCFGPGAALYDCIMVQMDKGKTAEYTTRAITVEGVFRIKEYKYPNGKHFAIYHMDGESAK